MKTTRTEYALQHFHWGKWKDLDKTHVDGNRERIQKDAEQKHRSTVFRWLRREITEEVMEDAK